MNAVRQILDDLRDKRLWPLALLLVAALVAVPLLVGRGAAEPVAVAPPAREVAKASPAVVLAGPPSVRSRPGELRDPFRRARKRAPAARQASPSPPAAKASKASKASAQSSSSSSKRGASTGSATPEPRTAPPPPPPVVTLASRSVYVTEARFAGGMYDFTRAIARLTVLGDRDNPALQYLGVSRGGEYAIFLLGPAATAGGDDGACVVADPCRAIGLRRGDTLEVSVDRPGAGPGRYTLEVTSLRRVARASRAAARRERERVAAGGRAALRAFAEDAVTRAALGRLLYWPITGTVVLVGSP